MKRFVILVLLALAALPVSATTKIYMKKQFSSAIGVSGGTSTYQYASLAQSVLALQTAITNSASSGKNIQMTQTAGGTLVAWISPPVAVGFTTSTSASGFTANAWASENSTSCNCGLLVQVSDLNTSCTIVSTSRGTELTTSITVQNWTATQSACTIAVGNRILIQWRVTNVGTMASGHSVTMDYAGPTSSADGDTWIQTPDTISFQSEAEFIQANTNGIFSGKTASGDSSVCWVEWIGAGTVTGGSDGTNSYTAIANLYNSSFPAQIIYAQNETAGGPYTVTPSTSGISGGTSQWCADYGGLSASSVDVTGQLLNNTNTSPTSGSATTNFTNEIIVGLGYFSGQTSTPGTGFVERQTVNEIFDTSVTASNSYNANATIASSAWALGMVAFKWGTTAAAGASMVPSIF